MDVKLARGCPIYRENFPFAAELSGEEYDAGWLLFHRTRNVPAILLCPGEP
jgi:hypothetical protein